MNSSNGKQGRQIDVIAVDSRLPMRINKIPAIWWVALIYMATITLAETFTTLISPQAGLILHGIVLLLLLLQAAFSDHIETQRFLLALALAPLTRLLSLVLPLRNFPLIYWYLLVGAPLGMASVLAARAGRMKREELGLSLGYLPYQVLFSLSGVGLGYLEYLILRPKPLISALQWEKIWLPALILMIFTGLLEEFIFRGLLQSSAIKKLGRGGIIFSAGIFAILHFGYQSMLDILFVFLVALFFGYVVKRSHSILGVTLAHGLTNITMFLVFPFLIAP